jgi:hypothetical protein
VKERPELPAARVENVTVQLCDAREDDSYVDEERWDITFLPLSNGDMEMICRIREGSHPECTRRVLFPRPQGVEVHNWMGQWRAQCAPKPELDS